MCCVSCISSIAKSIMETLATIELSVMARCFRQRHLVGFNLNTFFFLNSSLSRWQRLLSLQNNTRRYFKDCHNTVNCGSLSCILCNFCFPLCVWAAAGNVQNCHGPCFAGRTKLPGWPTRGGRNKDRSRIRNSFFNSSTSGLIYATKEVLFVLKYILNCNFSI